MRKRAKLKLQTHRHFTRVQFQYDQVENVFRCPQGQTLRYRGMDRQAQGYLYQTTKSQCRGCPIKKRCTGGSTRRIFVHWHEPARQTARELAGDNFRLARIQEFLRSIHASLAAGLLRIERFAAFATLSLPCSFEPRSRLFGSHLARSQAGTTSVRGCYRSQRLLLPYASRRNALTRAG